MFGDVTARVAVNSYVDVSGIGAQVKVGVAANGTAGLVKISRGTTADKVRQLLGDSPLADACILSLEHGAQTVYAKGLKADTEGAIGELAHTGTGTGSLEVSGSPTNTFQIRVEILDTGETNAGSFRVSADGGNSYSDEQTIPLSGEYAIPNTGLALKFVDASTDVGLSFVKGDAYTCTCTAPSINNVAILQAFDGLLADTTACEMVHVVGPTSSALWASLASYADRFLAERKKPMAIVVEARGPEEGESLESYVQALKQARKDASHYELQAVASWGHVAFADGRLAVTNLAGIVTGLYGMAKEPQSVGEVRSFPVSEDKLLKLLPEGIEGYTEALDGMGYCVFRKYDGRDGYFVANANMLAPEKSDYRYMEDVRVLNRLIKEVRMQALEELQRELDPDDMEAEKAAIEASLMLPVQEAVEDKVISAGGATVLSTAAEILATESMDIQISYTLHGHLRNINLFFSRNE